MFSNYRPVSVLSVFSRILEKRMYNRLIKYINKHKIFYKLYLPGGKNLKMYTDNFSYSGGMIWNTVPSDVREVKSHTAFKSSYVKWYRQ